MLKNNSLKTTLLFLAMLLIGLIVNLFNNQNKHLVKQNQEPASVYCSEGEAC